MIFGEGTSPTLYDGEVNYFNINNRFRLAVNLVILQNLIDFIENIFKTAVNFLEDASFLLNGSHSVIS